MASLQDIADELDVSVSLVSKVLNARKGTGGASLATYRAIRAKAAQLGYRKNISAAALAKGKQGVIGVFIHRKGLPGSAIAEELVEGIADEAGAQGQRLMLQFFETADQFKALCPSVDRNVLDGLIVGGVTHPELFDELVQFEQRDVAVVTVHDLGADPRVINVGMDQVEVSRLATAHLIERGCRNIAHIAAIDGGTPRFDGYRKALAEAGIPYKPELVIHVPGYGARRGEEAVAELTSRGLVFDGIVAQSDHQAIGAMNTLLRAGRRVPQDVRVIGVDNAPFCELSIVPLSSISQEFRERGSRAVRLLLERMNGKAVSSITISPRLCCRASSA